ncbi:hypothetical protein, partial [Thermoflexus sp.]|uniref:hypothetical protein n=1 Tax=Thermoflexus sp. TaxID=1969742 RepID=UPI002ADDCDD4
MSERDALKLSLSALICYAQFFLQGWEDPREEVSEFLPPLNSNDEAHPRLAEALAASGEVPVAQCSEPIRLRSIFNWIETALPPDRAGGYPLRALDCCRETLFPQRPRLAATEEEYRAPARSLREAIQRAKRFARGHPAARIAGLLGAMVRFTWCVPAASPDAFEKTIEFIPSDTLFAALVAVAVEQWGERAAQAIEEAFGEPEPPFLLTGAFPALPQLRFFPRPAAWSPGPGKALKRLRWVSEGLLARLARGEPVKDEDLFPSEGGEEPERTLAKIAPVRLLREEQSRLPRPMQRGDLAAWRLWDAAFQRPAVVVSRGGGRTFLYDIAMARYG